jgi:cation diffusion facilitator CzcD-associated flavoprotein CzcO
VATRDERYTCSFLYLCSGYYRYDKGYTPQIPGLERFEGPVIHPQHWPDDLDYAGKHVVVIGSGATAVTLVPALAPEAAHVTMLQRSPSWLVNRHATDGLADTLRRLLPERIAHRINRSKNAVLNMAFYEFCQNFPKAAAQVLRNGIQKELPTGLSLDPHFSPAYDPWDQRMCLVPDNDLFVALRSGKASVVTDLIETVTENGVRLASGAELPADLLVTATGLAMQVAGGAQLDVDGVAVSPAQHLVYRGMMLSDVPNLAICIGYTNSSWTLRSDMAAQYICRLLNHLDRHGYATVVAVPPPGAVPSRPLFDLTSGYIQRAADRMPKQANRPPWRYRQNYLLDLAAMRLRPIAGPSLRFDRYHARAKAA